jgi:hypothetical protein
MNCKPGDLAFYVGRADNLRGFIFRCVERAPFGGEAAWVTEPPPPPGPGYVACGLVLDESLRAIRPGDISDEEVRDLYAPKQTESA